MGETVRSSVRKALFNFKASDGTLRGNKKEREERQLVARPVASFAFGNFRYYFASGEIRKAEFSFRLEPQGCDSIYQRMGVP